MLSDVVNVTGPEIMTIAILESLDQLLGRTVGHRDFSGIKHLKLVGVILIRPGASFAVAQYGYLTDQGDALIPHHYEGSWKQADAEAKGRNKQAEQMPQSTAEMEVYVFIYSSLSIILQMLLRNLGVA